MKSASVEIAYEKDNGNKEVVIIRSPESADSEDIFISAAHELFSLSIYLGFDAKMADMFKECLASREAGMGL